MVQSVRAIFLLLVPALASAEPVPVPVPAATPAAEKKKEKKPLVALVLPETKRVVGYDKVKPYTGSDLEAEPAFEPSEVNVVEIVEKEEALALVRPWTSPLLGAIAAGARVPVKGVLHAKSAHGCPPKLWYALDPFGWVCGKSARPTAEAATAEPVLQVKEGERLPFSYVMVGVKEGDSIPMWATFEEARDGAEPERKLEKGDTVAVQKIVKIDGVQHYVSVEGKVLPLKGTFALGQGSEWHGEALDDKTVFPFGWVTGNGVKVFAESNTKKKPIDGIERRTRVPILEEAGQGGRRMVRIAEGRWLRAVDVNEVRKRERPEGITAAKQWIDVDLGEQVLVAYEGDKPVYATLTSSGRAIATPRGNYPVWAKVSAISMKSQPYEDKAYFVNKVPWVLFFQAHNAIHGAYWHDRFGVTKSHGCVNVAPLDARHLFEWLTPALPGGWSGYRTPDLLASATVHVYDSRQKKMLIQERPIGPPDKELEAQKMEEAEERRAAADTAGMKP
jgi:lipoprotein-anchoring transpeptidase ErfK/SrfK